MQTDERSRLIKSTKQLRPEESALRGDILKISVMLDQKHCKDLFPKVTLVT